VAGTVPQDAEALVGAVAGAVEGSQPAEPGAEKFVLLAEAANLIMEGVDPGREGTPAGHPGAPAVLGQADPAGDESTGVPRKPP